MGILSRSVSILRYRVSGEVEGSFWDSVHEGIKVGSFRQTETPGDEVGRGWVAADDFTRTELLSSSYLHTNYVVLSFRVDTARVPPKALDIEMKKEIRRTLEQTGQKRLSTRQKRELKDQLKEALKNRILPSVQVFDLVWDTSKGMLYFNSLSVKAREMVEAHFKKCFGLTLIPLIPFIRAQELLTDKKLLGLLDDVRPCSFVPGL